MWEGQKVVWKSCYKFRLWIILDLYHLRSSHIRSFISLLHDIEQITLWNHYLHRTIIHNSVHTYKCSQTDEQISKMCCIHAMEYYSSNKRKATIIHATKWMSLEDTMLMKDASHFHFYTWFHLHEKSIISKSTEIQSRLMVPRNRWKRRNESDCFRGNKNILKLDCPQSCE